MEGYIENISMVPLMASLKMEWRELLNGGVLNCRDYCTENCAIVFPNHIYISYMLR